MKGSNSELNFTEFFFFLMNFWNLQSSKKF